MTGNYEGSKTTYIALCKLYYGKSGASPTTDNVFYTNSCDITYSVPASTVAHHIVFLGSVVGLPSNTISSNASASSVLKTTNSNTSVVSNVSISFGSSYGNNAFQLILTPITLSGSSGKSTITIQYIGNNTYPASEPFVINVTTVIS